MHDWHQQAGAKFIHAGAWLRPEYYQVDGKTREQAILAEAQQVRDCLGLIDLGTLGKIQVSGPDAVEFLERLYTGKFQRQKIGQTRYVMACDETGVVIDDGVVARLDKDRFYVSATTGGVAAFFREMQRWALLWDSDLQIAERRATATNNQELPKTFRNLDSEIALLQFAVLQNASSCSRRMHQNAELQNRGRRCSRR